jgi:hypothetical protein
MWKLIFPPPILPILWLMDNVSTPIEEVPLLIQFHHSQVTQAAGSVLQRRRAISYIVYCKEVILVIQLTRESGDMPYEKVILLTARSKRPEEMSVPVDTRVSKQPLQYRNNRPVIMFNRQLDKKNNTIPQIL